MNDFENVNNTLAIVTTIDCPLSCRHCSVGKSETKKNTGLRLRQEVCNHYIAAAAQNGFSLITFVGGEPAMVPDLVKNGIIECKNHSIESAVTTAPVWARTKEAADKFLDRIGLLDKIIFSFDEYHLEQLTLKHYQNACNAANKRGIKILINICYSSENEKHRCTSLLSPMHEQISQYYYQEIIPVGNARIVNNNIQYTGITLESLDDLDRLPRTCMIGNASVGLQFDLHACCWASAINKSPLCFRSNSSDLNVSIRGMHADPAFRYLRKRGLIDGLNASDRKVILKQCIGRAFVNECHLCMMLMGLKDRELWNQIFKRVI
jgi:pyruvate-formate lyase-activating enzyme